MPMEKQQPKYLEGTRFGKTKSKFKEVLQMSYLKPSCNCKFCQL